MITKKRKVYLDAIKTLKQTIEQCRNDKINAFNAADKIYDFISSKSHKHPLAVANATMSAIYCIISDLDTEEVSENCIGSIALMAIYQAGRLDALENYVWKPRRASRRDGMKQ